MSDSCVTAMRIPRALSSTNARGPALTPPQKRAAAACRREVLSALQQWAAEARRRDAEDACQWESPELPPSAHSQVTREPHSGPAADSPAHPADSGPAADSSTTTSASSRIVSTITGGASSTVDTILSAAADFVSPGSAAPLAAASPTTPNSPAAPAPAPVAAPAAAPAAAPTAAAPEDSAAPLCSAAWGRAALARAAAASAYVGRAVKRKMTSLARIAAGVDAVCRGVREIEASLVGECGDKGNAGGQGGRCLQLKREQEREQQLEWEQQREGEQQREQQGEQEREKERRAAAERERKQEQEQREQGLQSAARGLRRAGLRNVDVQVWVKSTFGRVAFEPPTNAISFQMLPYSQAWHAMAHRAMARLPQRYIAVHYRSEFIAFHLLHKLVQRGFKAEAGVLEALMAGCMEAARDVINGMKRRHNISAVFIIAADVPFDDQAGSVVRSDSWRETTWKFQGQDRVLQAPREKLRWLREQVAGTVMVDELLPAVNQYDPGQ
ncbi:unnamed protein product [Closterium sp. Yama58-4]|nr:unnamed protein product [Closterium sp. Yama58-4]